MSQSSVDTSFIQQEILFFWAMKLLEIENVPKLKSDSGKAVSYPNIKYKMNKMGQPLCLKS